MFKRLLSKLVIKIYIVEHWREYEGSEILGIYFQEKYAKAKALEELADALKDMPYLAESLQENRWGIEVEG